MVSLSWKYSLRIDVEETAANAEKAGLRAVWLYGHSRTKHEEYPLNQIRLVGGNLDPNLKVMISPNSTEFFYSNENPTDLSELEKGIYALEDAERILNVSVRFASGETRRYSRETKMPIPSIGMLSLQIDLKQKLQDTLDKLENLYLTEINRAMVDFTSGDFFTATKKLENLLSELVSFHQELASLAKEWKDPRAQEWEKQLRNILSDPFKYQKQNQKFSTKQA